MKMRDAYGNLLVKLGREDKDIVVLDADMKKSCALEAFQKEFPERYLSIGIAEQNMMGIAAGLAAYGKIPFVNSYACFLSTKSCDQLRVAVAYTKLNVKIIAGHGGLATGPDGATHQALEDIGIVRSIPGMTVIVPADGIETERAVVASCIKYKGPVYVRLTRPDVEPIFDDSYEFQMGKAPLVKEGSDATIVACGIMVSLALEAANTLTKQGISTRVINMSSVKPLDDQAIIKAAEDTGAIVTAEDHNIYGGLGSAVAEVLVENNCVPMERIGVRDSFGKSGSTEELFKIYGLSVSHIVNAVQRVIDKKTRQRPERSGKQEG